MFLLLIPTVDDVQIIVRILVAQLAVTPLHFGTSFHFPGMERFNGIPMEIFRLVFSK